MRDPYTLALRAAIKAIRTTRAAGSFSNGPVFHAIATSGVTVEEAYELTDEVIRTAFEMVAETDQGLI